MRPVSDGWRIAICNVEHSVVLSGVEDERRQAEARVAWVRQSRPNNLTTAPLDGDVERAAAALGAVGFGQADFVSRPITRA